MLKMSFGNVKSFRGCSLVVVLYCVCAAAQDTDIEQLTSEYLQTRIEAAKSSQDLNDQVRAFVVDQFNKALAELQTRKSHEENIQKLVASIEEAKASSAAELKEQVENIPETDAEDKKLADVKDAKIADEILNKQKVLLETRKAELKALDDEINSRSERRNIIPELKAENEKTINEEDSPPPIAVPPAFEEASRLLRKLRVTNATLQNQLIAKQLEFFHADEELLPLRREKVQRIVNSLETSVENWTARAGELRLDAIDRQKQRAIIQRDSASDALVHLAQVNLDLITPPVERQGRLLSRKKVDTELNRATAELVKSSETYETLKKRFEERKKSIGADESVSEAIGVQLIKDRKDLPNVRTLRRDSDARNAKLFDAQFALDTINQELRDLANIGQVVEETKARIEQETQTSVDENELRQIIEFKYEILKDLEADYGKYTKTLRELNLKDDALIKVVEEFTDFADRRILWIRNAPPISTNDIADFGAAVSWLSSPTHWRALADTNWKRELGHPFANLTWFTVVVLLVVYRIRFRQHVNEIGRQAMSKVCQDFSITIEVLIYTLARSAIWPVLLLWIAWNLSHLGQTNENGSAAVKLVPSATQTGNELIMKPAVVRTTAKEFVLARPLASGIKTFAYFSFPIFFWLRAIRPLGLADAHLNWSQQQRRVASNNLRLLWPIMLPAIGLFKFFEEYGNYSYEKSAGRFCLVVATLAIAWCIRRPMSPTSGIFAEHLNRHRGGWLDRLKSIWYPAVVLIPISFVVLALMGYQHTAAELWQRFYISAAFLSGLYLLDAVSKRWLLVNHRRLAIQQARERLAQRQAEAEGHADEEDPQITDQEMLDGVTESSLVDLSAVSTQSKRLLNSVTFVSAFIGLYVIWVAVLPALAKLDDYKLWTESSPATTSAQSTSGGPATPVTPAAATTSADSNTNESSPTIETGDPVTLGSLIKSFVILAMMVIAVQNIPGLMEIGLLQRLPLEVAIRYAIKSVTRYIIIIVGLIWAFNTIGIGWSKVQFLAAAVSVGLGFGLQEIFANFVSGLILLFERPLRAGDIVTVGDVSGRVVQIKTRATTILDWDGKELIVPNKEFITGKVLNWTLTSSVNRIVITVGIAYGADVKQAKNVILDVTHQHPLIVEDPAPTVTFDSFGDSSLNLTVRCFLPNLDNRLSVIHELHEAIHERLSAAGIEIPFPQRDLNVRSIDGTLAIDSKS